MVLLISASPAGAQSRLWVSAGGSDVNACSQQSPCATFQGAINKGSVSQVNCLTSGSYGPFTITASITVDCGTGNIGTIFAPAGNAITITTGPGVIVVLRHLSLNGRGGNSAFKGGILAQSFNSGTLIVEDCMIQGFGNGGAGIVFSPTGGRGLLQVSNSQIFDNAIGIVVEPAPGQVASVTLDRVEVVANSNTGLQLLGGIVAGTMRDSVAGENGSSGVYTDASQVFFTIEESSIVANLGIGIFSQSAGSVVSVGASTIGGNGTGVNAQAGSLISFGNNQMSANGINGSFSSTTALQ
jgi:hypothetical protein